MSVPYTRICLKDAVVEDKGKASKKDIEAAKGSDMEMYIGFDKSDTEPRKGRKGRLVKGNPEDYPERNDFTGGWAGGEKGLQQFIKQYEVLCSLGHKNHSISCIIHSLQSECSTDF